ncbi:IS3 family transposase [Corynebacterium hindlerae]|uniref:IS3 family transposase n=1 Tax=Corynebacterium hindlerae TaxID=699041 RepID=A0A7G5FDR0_9CORY|nr:IS3 family transposase [Corynebacterium hindlerae]QMV84751.1 IS3 family transposase [Corynebacterium hindlerae]
MFIMSQQRKRFTPEYRKEAARLVIESGRPIVRVAEEIGVSAGLLGRWVKNERERQGNEDGMSAADLRAENVRLRRELAEARLDNEFLFKSHSLLRCEATREEKFQLMQQEKATFSIKRMARLLEVSRSGFYGWVKRDKAKRRGKDPRQSFIENLDQQIYTAWEDSDEVYGAPRVTAKLAEQGIKVNKKTVAKRMKAMGIEGISPRMFTPVTTIQSKRKATLPDLVKRAFDAGELNRVWLSDITYLRTGEGWLYLCAVRDGHSRRVIGWAMDRTQSADLVERALRMAHTLRGEVPDGVVFHADRGSQFTSDQLWQVCQELGIAQSVGRTGVCFDNAMSESFWSTLKTEFYDRKKWATCNEARNAVAQWIEVVYNRRRIHSSLGMKTPVAFENAINNDPTKPNSITPKAA